MSRPQVRRSATLVDQLEHQFESAPDRVVAVFLEDGDNESTRLTARQLQRRAKAVAATLQSEARSAARALLLYPSGPEFVAAYLGCLYAGIIPAPCHPPSRNRLDARVASIAANAEPQFILAQDRVVSGATLEIPGAARARTLSAASCPDDAAAAWKPPAIDPDSIALLQYTSGSTADPRGVMVSHANLLANLWDLDRQLQHDSSSVIVTWLPIHHDMGLIYGVLQPLVYGFPFVMMPPAAFLQSPARWLRAFTTYRGTHSTAPNFAYDLCAQRIGDDVKATLDLSSWVVAVNGAEPVRADTLTRFTAAFAECGFRPDVFSPAFGLAESTLMVTITRRGELPTVVDADPAMLARGRFVAAENGHSQPLVGCGVPVAETLVRIVSPDSGKVCAAGEVGEIWVGGPVVAHGYWDNPADSTATFGAGIAGQTGMFLRTGDLGFVHRDALFVTGRAKDVVIHHGLNYYPQDIERTVEASHPSLAPAGSAAFGVQERDGEELVIVAEIQRTARRQLDLPSVIEAVRRRVTAEHGLAPRHVVLLHPRTLPKTSSGKVRRRACRELFLGNSLAALASWSDDGSAAATTVNAPVSTREWVIERVAARLRVASASIDTRAPLADLGLDSLAATQIAGELQQWLGRPVPATALYDYPTIEALAAHLDGVSSASAPGAAPSPATTAIAIVGLGCRFPGARSVEEFWSLLREGVDAIRETPPSRWPAELARFGGFIDDVELFDAEFFGIAPLEAQRMDPQQRLLLEIAWESLEDAGVRPDSLAGTRTGVFVGVTNSDYGRLLIANGAGSDRYLGTGSALSIVANRLSYALDLRGPSLAIDTACSSSLVAVALACQSLRKGECALALAGGANLLLSPEYTQAFAAAGMMSADGRCKTFDASADGYVRGEGVGIVVLKRLEDAERDGDRVLAVIRGAAVNQDGRSSGLTAPNGPAQAAVVRAALDDARVAPSQVTYVEAHGTGTALGDPIEFNALASVLAEGRDPQAICHVGSVKTNIGHLEAAAGIAGLIKTTLALGRGEIPPSLHCSNVNPLIPAEGTPLRIATSRRPWSDGPRIAGVSSFGFGGTNAHVILEEYRAAPVAAEDDEPFGVLTVSAKNRAALATAVDRHVALLRDSEARFADVCFTAAIGRAAFRHRVAVVARDADEAAAALRDHDAGALPAAHTSGVTFLFTGHGAEHPGMGAALYQHEPAFRRALDDCSEILRPALGAALPDLLYGASPAPLDDLSFAQPAIVAMEIALARLWAAWGIRPAAVIGHSLGELAAAHVAGVMTLDDTLSLVAARGRLLQSIAGDGAMAVAMASAAQIDAAIAACDATVVIAAVNSATNTVFSGRRAEVDAVIAQLGRQGVKCSMLPTAHAFHSPLVDPILDAFEAATVDVRQQAPSVPFVSNVTGRWHEAAPDASYWRRHLREPVRFAEGLRTLRDTGHRVHVEIGAHRLLAAIGAESDSSPETVWVSSLARDRDARRTTREAAARLWVHGADIAWRAVLGPGLCKTTLPTYPFQRQRYWLPARRSTAQAGAPGTLRQVHIADAPGRRIFETTLTAVDLANLLGSDHNGPASLAPAGLLMDCVLSSAGLQPPLACHNLAFTRPLVLDDRPRVVQVILDEVDRFVTFGLFSRVDDESFQRHAAGRIHVAPSASASPDTAPTRVVRTQPTPAQTRAFEALFDAGSSAAADDARPAPGTIATIASLEVLAPMGADLSYAAISRDGGVDVDAVRDRTPVARVRGATFRSTETLAPLPSSSHYRVEWIAAECAPRHSRRMRWLLVGGVDGVADAVAELLERQGARSVSVPVPSGRDYRHLLQLAADRLGGAPDGIVHLGGVEGVDMAPAAAIGETAERSAVSVLLTMQAVVRGGSKAKLWIATHGAARNAAHGLAATFALEHPEHWGAHIRLEGGAELAPAIVAELVADAGDDHVLVSASGQRRVARLARIATPPPDVPTIHPDASYLIVGGLGTIGLAVARALADSGARHLVLIGRRGPDTPDKQAAVTQLRNRGIVVTTPAVDVANTPTLRAAISAIQPPVRGIVHAAGTASFTLLSEAAPDALTDALRTKPMSAATLATLVPAPDFFVTVSSMIGAWGAEGQGLYAAANALVDALAAEHVLPMTSVALGPVRGGLLPAALAERMERMGVSVWSPDRAAAAILHAAASSAPTLIAAEIDWARYKPLIESRGRRPLFDAVEIPIDRVATSALRDRLRVAGAAERQRLLTQVVLGAAAAALGMRPEAWADLERGFFEMGMDSIAALDVRTRLERALGATFPPTLIFNHPNVNALTAAIAALLADGAGATASKPSVGVAATLVRESDEQNHSSAVVDADRGEEAARIDARLEHLERLVARG